MEVGQAIEDLCAEVLLLLNTLNEGVREPDMSLDLGSGRPLLRIDDKHLGK